MWQSFLRKRIDNAAAELRGDATSSVELLVSQGLVTRGVQGEKNAYGVTATMGWLRLGQTDGQWAAVYIDAALAAGADVGAIDCGGVNCLWHA
jgi:hypothetical protein